MTMEDVRYEIDHAGLEAIGNSPALQAVCVQAAQAGAEYAAQVAPEGEFRAEARDVTVGWGNDRRAGAAVVNDSPDALFDPLQRNALDAAVAVIEGGQSL